MCTTTQKISRWTVRIAASVIILIGLFWTWFGLACAWPDPLDMLMHILIPGLPLLALGLLCWWQPAPVGVILVLWGASPLLSLVGGSSFFNYHGQWLTLTPFLVFWLPLLMGLLLIAAGIYRVKSLDQELPDKKIDES